MKRNVVSAAGTCLVVLILGLQGCGDNPLRSRIIKLTTLARNGQAVYVSTDGNDSNLGTVELPKLTIAAAIKVFADEGLTGTVKVSEGSYKVDPFGGSSIEMVEGVSVAGGFSRDFASNDPTAHETIIQDSSGGPFQDGAFPSAVSFGAGITA